MLLTINIGNSNIRFGLFKHNDKTENLQCNHSWIISSIPYKSSDEYILLFKNIYDQKKIFLKQIKNIVIGSVVPQLTNVIYQSIYEIHKINPLIVNKYSKSPIKEHNFHQLGTDLYANAIAAYIIYKKTTLVIDFGTALSLICIDKYRTIKGVIISPGINISLNSLIKNTSQLSQIELKKPSSILGINTESCIQSGIIYGYLSMVEGLINRINNELKEKCFVVSTGGLSHIYTPLTNKIHIKDKLHTIKGLKILFDCN
ncbi:type III pantothenate kinase [Blattabacterium cuenoti]|uniref:type III pantothenate kinase n=1 Tax=Blattabacterium cuenoti TaxID=1653831 RepID=UPI00163D1EA8|nr:type III pantothenate kinase [Blattabacterium cuenoti]